MMKRILCIWLPNWPIQRLLAARPEIEDRPVVLCETVRRQQRVAACCRRAAALGISVGMPISEVAAVVGNCKLKIDHAPRSHAPHGNALPRRSASSGNGAKSSNHERRKAAPAPGSHAEHGNQDNLQFAICNSDPLADRDTLESIARDCRRFSPVVGLDDVSTPDTLFLDITGVTHLFSSEAALAEEVLDHLARCGFAVCAGIAGTLKAAWAVAHFKVPFLLGSHQAEQLSICNLQFAICTSLPLQSRERLFIVPRKETLNVLRPLPIEALQLSRKTIDLLHQLGVHTIARLEALPRRELSSRFGPELPGRIDQAAGRIAEPIRICQAPPAFEAQWAPDYSTARRETIEAAMRQLLETVAEQLLKAGRGAVRLQCRLQCTLGEAMEISVGLFEPSAAAEHLFGLMQVQLERLRLPGPVRLISVTAEIAVPLQRRQGELFAGENSRRNLHHVACLIDRLSGRLGRDAVVGASLVAEALPEFAWRAHPLTGDKHRRRPGKRPAKPRPRPLCLLRQPIALQEMPNDARSNVLECGDLSPLSFSERFPLEKQLLGTGSPKKSKAVTSRRTPKTDLPDIPPSRFHLHGRWHEILHRWGPERIETGWWRGCTVGRDYYRVETTAGRRFWLFRRLRDGRWFVHGIFQ